MAQDLLNTSTKVLIQGDSSGDIVTSFIGQSSGILGADIIGVSTDPYVTVDYQGVEVADGIIHSDASVIPGDLKVTHDREEGTLILDGLDSEKYSIDQQTGHITFTE